VAWRTSTPVTSLINGCTVDVVSYAMPPLTKCVGTLASVSSIKPETVLVRGSLRTMVNTSVSRLMPVVHERE